MTIYDVHVMRLPAWRTEWNVSTLAYLIGQLRLVMCDEARAAACLLTRLWRFAVQRQKLADLSTPEPVVATVGHVLTACLVSGSPMLSLSGSTVSHKVLGAQVCSGPQDKTESGKLASLVAELTSRAIVDGPFRALRRH